MKVKDIYIGTGETFGDNLVIQLESYELITITLSQEQRLKLSDQLRKRELAEAKQVQAQVQEERRKRLETEPKVPCGVYGCRRPKPQSLMACTKCLADFDEDPDAYK